MVIPTGDPAGIGPEITLKAIAAERERHADTRFVVVGNRAQLREWQERLGFAHELGRYPEDNAGVSVLDPGPELPPSGRAPYAAGGATAALGYLQRAARGCLEGEFSGMVTAPLSKQAILRAGIAFIGQTEFLAGLAGVSDVTMMLLGEDASGRWLRVALATTHLPLSRVAEALQTGAILRAIRHSAEACERLGVREPRIGVCGLNPHAGEGGLLGDEEARVIEPALAEARLRGLRVAGPLGADTIFHSALEGVFDAVVAMYHDQGLGPLKTIAFNTGVNWSLGLPFPRTSPDHGTAFDIAGRGIANPSSMRAALRLAIRLADQPAQVCGRAISGWSS
jgi:4-hydroxythreonine-4-phosphate dehydrogenase